MDFRVPVSSNRRPGPSRGPGPSSPSGRGSVVDVDPGALWGPVEQRLGVLVAQADAAVAAALPEVAAPVDAVDRVVAHEGQHPLHVWDVVAGAGHVGALEP